MCVVFLQEAARLIWFAYLRHYGYAFRDQPQNTRLSRDGGSGSKEDTVTGPSKPDDSSTNNVSSSQSQSCSESVSNGRCNSKRRQGGLAPKAKRAKTEDVGEKIMGGFYDFPDDSFLFENTGTQDEITGSCKEAVQMDTSECVRIMESISSWEELDKLERTMDCKQLLKFRQAYLSSHNSKPKFVSKGERWGSQPRVFKQYMTVSVLYLALLYTAQPILPVDIVRCVCTVLLKCMCLVYCHVQVGSHGEGSTEYSIGEERCSLQKP